jgi:DNA-binding NtrC family response regulator
MYRLQVVELRIPPLRDRLGDVPKLALHFVELHARAQRKQVRAIAPDAMAVLTAYAWPGNVRELSNVIERGVILASDETITPIDLPTELGVAPPPPDAPLLGTAAGEAHGAEDWNLAHAVLSFQRTHIASVLDRTHGSRDAAARLLGLSPATLYRHLQRVGLKGYRPEDEAAPKSPCIAVDPGVDRG